MKALLLKAPVVLGAALLVSACAGQLAHKGAVLDPQLTASIQPGVDNKASVEKLLGHPKLAGIKDSENNPARLEELLARYGGKKDFSVFVGVGALQLRSPLPHFGLEPLVTVSRFAHRMSEPDDERA